MSTANSFEREMLMLINQERTSRGLDSVQLETRLNDSSEVHSKWMLNTDTFSHTGSGGSNATKRMEATGFDLSGNWRTGENIAWQSERGAPSISDDVMQLHQNLMNSPGHRANILNPEFKYVGIGIETGDMQGFDAVMVTQNFAVTDAEVFLDNEITPPQPEPVTAVNEVAKPEDSTTETPITDETETEKPEIATTDTDIMDTGDPAECLDVPAALAEFSTFTGSLRSHLDQFSWNSAERTLSGSALEDMEGLAEIDTDFVDEAPVADMVNNGACDLFVFTYFDMNCMLEAA